MPRRYWIAYVVVFAALIAAVPQHWPIWAGMLAVAALAFAAPSG